MQSLKWFNTIVIVTHDVQQAARVADYTASSADQGAVTDVGASNSRPGNKPVWTSVTRHLRMRTVTGISG